MDAAEIQNDWVQAPEFPDFVRELDTEKNNSIECRNGGRSSRWIFLPEAIE
jgi:hypothetical protein